MSPSTARRRERDRDREADAEDRELRRHREVRGVDAQRLGGEAVDRLPSALAAALRRSGLCPRRCRSSPSPRTGMSVAWTRDVAVIGPIVTSSDAMSIWSRVPPISCGRTHPGTETSIGWSAGSASSDTTCSRIVLVDEVSGDRFAGEPRGDRERGDDENRDEPPPPTARRRGAGGSATAPSPEAAGSAGCRPRSSALHPLRCTHAEQVRGRCAAPARWRR